MEMEGTENKFTLEFLNLSHNDEGWYSCLIVADYDESLNSNASVYLKVVDPPVRKPWYSDVLTITLVVILVLFSAIAAITVIFISYRYKRKEEKLDMEMAKATVLTQCIIKKIIIEKDKHIREDSMNIPKVKIETCSNCDTHAVRKDSFSTVVYELPPDNEYEFPLEQLKLGQIIGQGEFGEVFKAEAFGISQTNVTTVVAVKMLKEDHKECDVRALVTEMEIMKLIGKHDNIINLLGCCNANGKLRVITEYATNGNLRDYLRTYNAPISSESSYAQSKIEKDKLLNFAHQIAKGMEFLASKKCIHRDLAARNILVTEHYVMKIADFGLARDVRDVEYYKNMTSECKLPLKWMPPESIFYKKFTTQSDVWSYGVLLWEIMTMGGVPYPTIKMDNFYNYLRDGNRLERPPDCPTKVYQIMCSCWSDEANDRPDFSEIVKMLENLLTNDTNQINSRVSSIRFSWELPEFNGSSDGEDERDKLIAFTQDTFKPAIRDISHHWMSKHDFISNSNEVLCT